MRTWLLFVLCLSVNNFLFSQNIGIGVVAPVEKLTINGNFYITGTNTKTNSSPSAGNTFAMSGGGDTARFITDSVYRIYDPGGVSPYTQGLSSSVVLFDTAFEMNTSFGGIELIFETIQLGTGDTITLLDAFTGVTLAKFSNQNNGQTPSFTGVGIHIFFKSNNDASVGQGFAALVKKLFPVNGSTGNAVAETFGGSSLLFNSSRGSLRAGIGVTSSEVGAIALGTSSSARGKFSIALGYGSAALQYADFSVAGGIADGGQAIAIGGSAKATTAIAIGRYSFATGNGAAALGPHALSYGESTVAVGNSSKAEGYQSMALSGASTYPTSNRAFAMGYGSVADLTHSIAMGKSALALKSHGVAIGQNAQAGENSLAFGFFANSHNASNSVAIGQDSYITAGIHNTAIGKGSSASGNGNTSVGYQNYSTGYYSTTLGNNSSTYNTGAIAIGSNVTADGNYSTAMGSFVTTSGYEGAFTIGDRSTTTVMGTFVANGMRTRFAGGYRFFTNSAATIGAFLNANANSWAALSDVRLKENFLMVDGEKILKSISLMPQYTWNYIGQDSKTLRHYGPMAQDFYTAFGKDEFGEIGCDTLINQQDFLGVNFIAIQALEKRSTDLMNENQQLKEDLKLLQDSFGELQRQVEALSENNKKKRRKS